MKQKIFFGGAFLLLIWAGINFFQSPEKYLLKKTKDLIDLGSKVDPKWGLSSKVAEINKYIHYDMRLKAEYEGQLYQACPL